MTKQLKLEIQANQREYWIVIQCLDFPVIDRWYETVKSLYRDAAIVQTFDSPAFKKISDASDEHRKNYKSILDSIETLKRLGVPWPQDEPEEFNFDHAWCNRVHRYFTTMSYTHKKLEFKSPHTYDIASSDMKTYTTAMQNINNMVHELEKYCWTEQKETFYRQMRYLHVKPLHFDSEDFYKIYQFHRFEKEDYQHHSWDHYDVIFDEEILGKGLLTSFFDNDDPKQLDTAGHAGWYGSFKILTDDTQLKIYESQQFAEWLDQHNVSKKTARASFPIGRVIDKSHDLDDIWKACVYANPVITIDFSHKY